MKKLLFICFFMYASMNLFAQNYDYGLSQDDLNLLLGFFVPDIETKKQSVSREWFFSWGKQNVIDNNNGFVIIDYNTNVNLKFDKKYEKHLLINESGFKFIITNIEKISMNKFKLSIVLIQSHELYGSESSGYIIITFSDTVHAVIDNTNCSKMFFDYNVLCKTSGPRSVN